MSHDLSRFITAQDTLIGGTEVWQQALAEITAGQKTTHWMWYVFPVITGIGRSGNAVTYAIHDLAEATAYLADPILGPRLIQISKATAAHTTLTADHIFGGTDAYKLQNCATLFRHVPGADPVFNDILRVFFHGKDADKTDKILGLGDANIQPPTT